MDKIAYYAAFLKDALQTIASVITKHILPKKSRNALYMDPMPATAEHEHEQYLKRGELAEKTYLVSESSFNEKALADHTHPQYVSDTDLADGKYHIEDADTLEGVYTSSDLARKDHTHEGMFQKKMEVAGRPAAQKAYYIDGLDPALKFAFKEHSHETYTLRGQLHTSTLSLADGDNRLTAADFAPYEHDHDGRYVHTAVYKLKTAAVDIASFLRGFKLELHRIKDAYTAPERNAEFTFYSAAHIPDDFLKSRLGGDYKAPTVTQQVHVPYRPQDYTYTGSYEDGECKIESVVNFTPRNFVWFNYTRDACGYTALDFDARVYEKRDIVCVLQQNFLTDVVYSIPEEGADFGGTGEGYTFSWDASSYGAWDRNGSVYVSGSLAGRSAGSSILPRGVFIDNEISDASDVLSASSLQLYDYEAPGGDPHTLKSVRVDLGSQASQGTFQIVLYLRGPADCISGTDVVNQVTFYDEANTELFSIVYMNGGWYLSQPSLGSDFITTDAFEGWEVRQVQVAFQPADSGGLNVHVRVGVDWNRTITGSGIKYVVFRGAQRSGDVNCRTREVDAVFVDYTSDVDITFQGVPYSTVRDWMLSNIQPSAVTGTLTQATIYGPAKDVPQGVDRLQITFSSSGTVQGTVSGKIIVKHGLDSSTYITNTYTIPDITDGSGSFAVEVYGENFYQVGVRLEFPTDYGLADVDFRIQVARTAGDEESVPPTNSTKMRYQIVYMPVEWVERVRNLVWRRMIIDGNELVKLDGRALFFPHLKTVTDYYSAAAVDNLLGEVKQQNDTTYRRVLVADVDGFLMLLPPSNKGEGWIGLFKAIMDDFIYKMYAFFIQVSIAVDLLLDSIVEAIADLAANVLQALECFGVYMHKDVNWFDVGASIHASIQNTCDGLLDVINGFLANFLRVPIGNVFVVSSTSAVPVILYRHYAGEGVPRNPLRSDEAYGVVAINQGLPTTVSAVEIPTDANLVFISALSVWPDAAALRNTLNYILDNFAFHYAALTYAQGGSDPYYYKPVGSDLTALRIIDTVPAWMLPHGASAGQGKVEARVTGWGATILALKKE